MISYIIIVYSESLSIVTDNSWVQFLVAASLVSWKK